MLKNSFLSLFIFIFPVSSFHNEINFDFIYFISILLLNVSVNVKVLHHLNFGADLFKLMKICENSTVL